MGTNQRNKRKRDLLKISLSGIAALSVGSMIQTRSAMAEPNVLLILADDMGYGDLACYGSPDAETHYIDSIAEDGIKFTDFHSFSVCSPTRAELLSGLNSHHAGFWQIAPGCSFRPGIQLIPSYLSSAGYTCGIYGKWHLATAAPNAQGFDEFFGFLEGAVNEGYMNHGGKLMMNTTPTDEWGHLTDLFTNYAIKFIKDNSANPFFCYVAYNAPHYPSQPGKEEGKSEYVEKNLFRGVLQPRADYNALIEHVDECVGKILAALETEGVANNTLVIFASDNGPAWNLGGGSNLPCRGHKGTNLEGGMRVPCVMRWPGQITPGTVTDETARAYDLFSTILDVAGATVPATNGDDGYAVSGVSLVDLITSGTPLPARDFYWEFSPGYGSDFAVRSGKWKIYGSHSLGTSGQKANALSRISSITFELYDLDNDIGETTDLATSSPTVISTMKQSLIDWVNTWP